MEQEKQQLIEQIISTAKREFDIDLAKEKLISEEEYRALVFTELLSLENAELSRLIEQFNASPSHQAHASQAEPISQPKQRNTGVIIAASVAVLALCAVGAWFGLSGDTTAQSSQVAAVPNKVISQKSAQMSKPTPVEKEPEAVYQSLFAIHGSNTIGEKLAPALLKAYFEEQGAKDIDWQQGRIATERTMQFEMDGEKLEIGLAAHGSSTAFKALNANMAQIGMSSRKIKTSEVEALKGQSGDLSKLGNEHIIDTFYKVSIFEASQLPKFNHLTPDETIKTILDTIPDNYQVLLTDLLPENISVRNPSKITASGSSNQSSISFVVTPQDKNLQALLETYQNKEVVVLVLKRNTTHLYGTSDQPLLFKYNELNNPKPSGLKGYTIILNGEGYGSTKIFENFTFGIYERGLAFQLAQQI